MAKAGKWKRHEVRFEKGQHPLSINYRPDMISIMTGERFEEFALPPKASKVTIHTEPEIGYLYVDYMVD